MPDLAPKAGGATTSFRWLKRERMRFSSSSMTSCRMVVPTSDACRVALHTQIQFTAASTWVVVKSPGPHWTHPNSLPSDRLHGAQQTHREVPIRSVPTLNEA